MNIFFCCMKRDKPVAAQNKATKEALYNIVINDKFIARNSIKKKQGEDSESKAATNIEECSNISDQEKETSKALINPPELTIKPEKKFNLSISLDQEAKDYYEYLLYERDSKEEWVLETNKEDVIIWTKLDSKYQKNCPFIKACFKIKLDSAKNLTSDIIMNALYDTEKRKDWDKSVLVFENFNINEANNSCCYYMATKVPIVSNRDFLEKRFSFKDFESKEDVSVFWQIEDALYPKQPNMTRAYTRIGGTLIKFNENEIEIWTLSQVDTELKSFIGVLRKMLPGNLEKWVANLKAYLEESKK